MHAARSRQARVRPRGARQGFLRNRASLASSLSPPLAQLGPLPNIHRRASLSTRPIFRAATAIEAVPCFHAVYHSALARSFARSPTPPTLSQPRHRTQQFDTATNVETGLVNNAGKRLCNAARQMMWFPVEMWLYAREREDWGAKGKVCLRLSRSQERGCILEWETKRKLANG